MFRRLPLPTKNSNQILLFRNKSCFRFCSSSATIDVNGTNFASASTASNTNNDDEVLPFFSAPLAARVYATVLKTQILAGFNFQLSQAEMNAEDRVLNKKNEAFV